MDQALTCSWRILISIKLEQLEFKLEKIIRIQKHAGEVGKLFIFLLQDENINITQVFPSNVNFRFQRIHFELVRFSFLENNSLNTIIPQFFCFSRCLPKNPLGQTYVFDYKTICPDVSDQVKHKISKRNAKNSRNHGFLQLSYGNRFATEGR